MASSSIDSHEEDLARESSLVCRENRKLRERNRILEAHESEALAALQKELEKRATPQQLTS